MSIVALHLSFSKAGPRRGRLPWPPPLFPVSEPLRRLGPDSTRPLRAGVPASGGAGVYYRFNFPRRLRDRRLGDATSYQSRVGWLVTAGQCPYNNNCNNSNNSNSNYCCMRLEDPETPSGSQLSPHVSNPSGIAAQRRQSSAWVTTEQDVEHRAFNQVTTLTESLSYIVTSP